MNKRSRQAALRIQLLIEEFSQQELNEALSVLGAEPQENLLHFLNRMKSSNGGGRPSPRGSRAKESKLPNLIEPLKQSEPEKYELLRNFEEQLRGGERLRSLHDLRSFGQILDKGFDPGKSRHEGIDRLMKMLVQMKLEDLREIVRRAPVSRVEESDAFLRLSRHIIAGAKQPDASAE